MASEIEKLKGEQGCDKTLVASIFGWPLAGADGRPDFAKAEPHRIAVVPNPNSADTAHPRGCDGWPLRDDPDHRPAECWSLASDANLRPGNLSLF